MIFAEWNKLVKNQHFLGISWGADLLQLAEALGRELRGALDQ